ncbi:MAG: TolC family protein [Planctomycetes bacterium]|nr:TolC family protein [Planctomycetota bacterium]
MSRLFLVGLLAPTFGALLVGCAHTRSDQLTVSGNKPVQSSSTPVDAKSTDEADLSAEETPVPLTGRSQIKLVSANRDVQPTPPAVATDPPEEIEPGIVTAPADEPLSLEDLKVIAMQNNPTLFQAGAAVDQERGFYRQSGLYPNPQVGYLNSTANQSAPKQSNGVFLSQEIVTANKLSLAQQSASQEIKRLQWDQKAQEMRVLNDLTIRYYEVLGAQMVVEVTKQLERLAEESLSTAQTLFDAKTVSKSDVLQAQMLFETSRINLAEASHRYEAAWEQLAVMLGTPTLKLTPLSGDLSEGVPLRDLDSCWQTLLAESPQLRASESELDHGWAELRSAKAQVIPNVTLQNVTDYDRVTNSTTVSTLIALPVPFYNRNQGNIDKANADIRADQAEIRRVQLVLRDQLVESFRRYKTSRVQSERLYQSILPNAEENLKLTQQSYRGGEVPFRDVLAAQQAYAEARVAYIESLTELRKVVIEIDGLQLTGGLNPAAIGSALQSQPGGATQRQRALLNEVKDRAAKQLLPAAQIGQ